MALVEAIKEKISSQEAVLKQIKRDVSDLKAQARANKRSAKFSKDFLARYFGNQIFKDIKEGTAWYQTAFERKLVGDDLGESLEETLARQRA
ncbi:MAG: hypothetical protein M1819_006374 [Sarea resinae]|nr:MAG: hypothetical protein M1819_006374 [Sarea resinae]